MFFMIYRIGSEIFHSILSYIIHTQDQNINSSYIVYSDKADLYGSLMW